jgi:fucose 4-O-acetylase-like acetyltransferase
VAGAISAAGVSLGIAFLTPLLWTSWRPRWLPWYLESYINGVHTYAAPQPWLFPIFPWSAFAFAGLAAGFVLFGDWSMRKPGRTMALLGTAGVGIFFLSRWLDARPVQLYAVYDYWHTSPNFFLARAGLLLATTGVAYAWCRWGLGTRGFSPWIQLGQTSLIVYWVHTEFVYGRFSILDRHEQSIPMATLGLVVISIAMVLLSIARTRLKGRGKKILAWFRRLRSGEVGRTPGTAAEG